MSKKQILIFVLSVTAALIFGYLVGSSESNKKYDSPKSSGNENIDSFEECAAAGYPIQETFPRGCTANGRTFAEIIE